MRKSQAKKLTPGTRVIWESPGGRIEGTVTKKRYNTVWIKWDDGVEQHHFAEMMDYIWTAEQLEALKKEQEVARKLMQDKITWADQSGIVP